MFMSVITSQNWDSVTAPALPSGWTYGTGFATTTTGPLPVPSSPNMLVGPGILNADQVAFFNTSDSVNGDVIVTAKFAMQGSGAGGTPSARGSVCARGTNLNNAGTRTAYIAELDFLNNTAKLISVVSGTAATIVTFSAAFYGAYGPGATWFTLRLQCDGSALAVSIQTDGGQWLQPNGTWGATPLNCITATDGSVTGAGKAGLILYDANSETYSYNVYTDDFLFESLDNPSVASRPRAVPAPYTWWLHD